MIDASPEWLAQSNAFFADDVNTISKLYTETYGVKNTDQKIEAFGKLLVKWKELTNELDPGDVDALATLYWNEVLSKVDVEAYGLN